MILSTHSELRSLFPAASERSLRKQQNALDPHARAFIARSPFAVLGTAGCAGQAQVSPRGGDPGFIQTRGERELLLPDAPGNNRLDALSQILENDRVGLLFLLPGVEETLRVRGRAQLSTEAADLAPFSDQRRAPRLVIRIQIEVLFMHCAKALLRSGLWDVERQIARASFPSMGQILKDQIGLDGPPETQAEMLARYAKDL